MAWTNPDIKEHVNREDALNISSFMDKFLIVNRDKKINSQYKLKNNEIIQLASMYCPRLERLSEYINSYKDNFVTEPKTSVLDKKPMTKSFAEYRRVELYQLLLAFNDLYSSYEFEASTNPNKTISYPNNTLLTNMFSGRMSESNSKSMKAIKNDKDISSVNEMLNDAVSAQYEISSLLSDKLYMNKDDIDEVLDNPCVNVYLNSVLSESDDKTELSKKLSSMFISINRYVPINE